MDISLNYTLRFIKSTKSNVKETHESNSMLLFKISTSAELMHPSPFLSLSLSKQESTWQPCHSGILFRKWQSNPRLVALSNFFFFRITRANVTCVQEPYQASYKHWLTCNFYCSYHCPAPRVHLTRLPCQILNSMPDKQPKSHAVECCFQNAGR